MEVRCSFFFLGGGREATKPTPVMPTEVTEGWPSTQHHSAIEWHSTWQASLQLIPTSGDDIFFLNPLHRSGNRTLGRPVGLTSHSRLTADPGHKFESVSGVSASFYHFMLHKDRRQLLRGSDVDNAENQTKEGFPGEEAGKQVPSEGE